MAATRKLQGEKRKKISNIFFLVRSTRLLLCVLYKKCVVFVLAWCSIQQSRRKTILLLPLLVLRRGKNWFSAKWQTDKQLIANMAQTFFFVGHRLCNLHFAKTKRSFSYFTHNVGVGNLVIIIKNIYIASYHIVFVYTYILYLRKW